MRNDTSNDINLSDCQGIIYILYQVTIESKLILFRNVRNRDDYLSNSCEKNFVTLPFPSHILQQTFVQVGIIPW